MGAKAQCQQIIQKQIQTRQYSIISFLVACSCRAVAVWFAGPPADSQKHLQQNSKTWACLQQYALVLGTHGQESSQHRADHSKCTIDWTGLYPISIACPVSHPLVRSLLLACSSSACVWMHRRHSPHWKQWGMDWSDDTTQVIIYNVPGGISPLVLQLP